MLRAVAEAERQRAELPLPRGYLPIDGIPAYDLAVQQLLLGVDSPLIKEGRAITAHALGGTGGLKVGADLVRRVLPGRRSQTALVIVYIIQATAFGLFAAWPLPAGFMLSAILFGLSAWSIPAIVAATCGDILGSRLAPAGLGFVTLFFGIGQAAGPSIAGSLADACHSLSPVLLLASGVALSGAVGSLFLRSTSPKQNDGRV